MLAEEQEYIQDFIKERGLKIITEMPKDTIFQPNEYFRLSNGLYMNIISRGDLTRRPIIDTTTVFVRHWDFFILNDTKDSTYIDGNSHSREPIEFVYGYAESVGMQYPLQFLGDSAKVSLIVPSIVGDTDQESSVLPYYFGVLRYVFEK